MITADQEIVPGCVRLTGKGRPILTAADIVPQVQLPDGSWIRLRGVTEIHFHVRHDSIITADFNIELFEADFDVHPATVRALVEEWPRVTPIEWLQKREADRAMADLREALNIRLGRS